MTDIIRDINPLCPCWVFLKNGTQVRCDAPTHLGGDISALTFSFLSGESSVEVPFQEVTSFVSITNPERRHDR